MAIVRKPKKTETAEPKEQSVMALINKGGSTAASEIAEEREGDKETAIILRIPKGTVSRADKARKTRKVKTPRNTWLMEAVLEKLEREGF
jgi:hypothetical protein